MSWVLYFLIAYDGSVTLVNSKKMGCIFSTVVGYFRCVEFKNHIGFGFVLVLVKLDKKLKLCFLPLLKAFQTRTKSR